MAQLYILKLDLWVHRVSGTVPAARDMINRRSKAGNDDELQETETELNQREKFTEYLGLLQDRAQHNEWTEQQLQTRGPGPDQTSVGELLNLIPALQQRLGLLRDVQRAAYNPRRDLDNELEKFRQISTLGLEVGQLRDHPGADENINRAVFAWYEELGGKLTYWKANGETVSLKEVDLYINSDTTIEDEARARFELIHSILALRLQHRIDSPTWNLIATDLMVRDHLAAEAWRWGNLGDRPWPEVDIEGQIQVTNRAQIEPHMQRFRAAANNDVRLCEAVLARGAAAMRADIDHGRVANNDEFVDRYLFEFAISQTKLEDTDWDVTIKPFRVVNGDRQGWPEAPWWKEAVIGGGPFIDDRAPADRCFRVEHLQILMDINTLVWVNMNAPLLQRDAPAEYWAWRQTYRRVGPPEVYGDDGAQVPSFYAVGAPLVTSRWTDTIRLLLSDENEVFPRVPSRFYMPRLPPLPPPNPLHAHMYTLIMGLIIRCQDGGLHAFNAITVWTLQRAEALFREGPAAFNALTELIQLYTTERDVAHS